MFHLTKKFVAATSAILLVFTATLVLLAPGSVSAAKIPAGCPGGPAGPKAPNTKCPKKKASAKTKAAKVDTSDTCGSGDSATKIAINIGCRAEGNAILDMLFAFVRFLSNGVGLVLIGSLVWGGIQYTTSRGDPQGTMAATTRIRSVLTALLIYIFAYALLNYLIPGQVLQ